MGTLKFIRVPSLLKCYWSSECKWAGLRKGQLDLNILLKILPNILLMRFKKITQWCTTSTMCAVFLESRKGTLLESRSEWAFCWRNHKRCKTASSPMTKRALGFCSTMESETTPLRKTTGGIRFLLTSGSDWSSETSDSAFGGFSNNVSGEDWGASFSSSHAEADWGAEVRLTSVTPVLTEGFSVSSGDGGASPSSSWLSTTADESTGVLSWWCAADVVEPSDNPSRSLNPRETSSSDPWVSESAGSSRQGGLAGPSVDSSSPVAGCILVSAVVGCMIEPAEGGISSPTAWGLSDVGLNSCSREGVGAGSGAEGLVSMPCSDVWLPNSQWSLGKGCDLFGWTDSLAQGTKDELVCGVVSDDIQGNRSPGDTVWEDSVPSTDGSSWLGGTEGPDGWTAIC